MNTPQIMKALRDRYSGKEWAFFEQVVDHTGFAKSRTGDAIAMNTWPSRGLEIHGFEVKASRPDWKKELSKPEKAEALFQYCDRWWIVVGDKDIVQPGELPPTWGLLVPKGECLTVSKDAPTLQPKPLSRGFVASLLRNAAACTPSTLAVKAAREEGFHEGAKYQEEQNKYATRRDADARATLEKLQSMTGLFFARDYLKAEDAAYLKNAIRVQELRRHLAQELDAAKNISALLNAELDKLAQWADSHQAGICEKQPN